jgi:hypothetical protein
MESGQAIRALFLSQGRHVGLHPRGAGFLGTDARIQGAWASCSAYRRTGGQAPEVRSKYDLTVPLATDAEGKAMEAFGVWVEKQLYGKQIYGDRPLDLPVRADGTLFRAWRKVRVPGHADRRA